MKRFFFDIADQTYVQYDYRGRELGSLEEVRELAELVALDCECTDGSHWVGTEVQVRNTGGDRLFSIPIRQAECIAA